MKMYRNGLKHICVFSILAKVKSAGENKKKEKHTVFDFVNENRNQSITSNQS